MLATNRVPARSAHRRQNGGTCNSPPGGAITSDAGGRLLGSTDRAIGLVDRFAGTIRNALVKALDSRCLDDVTKLAVNKVLLSA